MEVMIFWDAKATLSITKIIDFIAEDSSANARSVAKDIQKEFEKIIQQPFIFPPDKYRKDKNSLYRAFELHKIRISYKVETNRILVVRCRHTNKSLCFISSSLIVETFLSTTSALKP